MMHFYDGFLEEHVAQLIDMQLREVSWKFDYDSVKNGLNKHWHVFAGHCEGSLRDDIWPIWQQIKLKWPELELERAYLNAHTHGIEPHIHRDDGALTFIYYPRLDWKNEWGGGTVLYDDAIKDITSHVNYKGNRLIKFPAYLPHQAQPVSRECYQLRTCVVFKTVVRIDENKDRPKRPSFGLYP
jgi:hypothetical protein|tara:strand:+ start:3285 stop:3836 length:552 start_codon:yes stop_codon:yes gene_type:complete